MSIITRIRDKIAGMRAQYMRGYERTLQMQDEKRRKRFEKAKLSEPGTLRYAMIYQQNDVLGFWKDAWERRKRIRREQEERRLKDKKKEAV